MHSPQARITLDSVGRSNGPEPGTCGSCRAPITPASRFCSSCGARVDHAAAQSNVESLLAQANLLRSQRMWSEAELRCIDVLKNNPNSADANVLLGDIYRDQNRLEEAAQWYGMALDLEPENAAVRAKLREVEDMAAGAAAHAVLSGQSSLGDSDRIGTQVLAGLTPTVWFRVIWASVGIFLIVVAVIAFGGSHSGQSPVMKGTVHGAPSTVSMKGPAPTAPPPPPAYNPKAFDSPPSPLTQPVAPASSSSASGQTSIGAPQQPLTDAALTDTVQRDAALSGGASVANVMFDVRDRHADLVVTEQVAPGATEAPGLLREQVERDAFRAARAVFNAEPSADRVSVDVRLAADGAPPSTWFTGDLDRQAAATVHEDASSAQLVGLFTSVWWAAPPADRPAQPSDSPSGPG